MVEESSGQIGKLAPTAFNEYVRDFWHWASCARWGILGVKA